MFQYVLQTAVNTVDDKLLWNAIGYHQLNKSTNRTVCALCLQLDCVIGQLQGQLTCHAWVNGL